MKFLALSGNSGLREILNDGSSGLNEIRLRPIRTATVANRSPMNSLRRRCSSLGTRNPRIFLLITRSIGWIRHGTGQGLVMQGKIESDRFGEILKLDESCISNPRLEISAVR